MQVGLVKKGCMLLYGFQQVSKEQIDWKRKLSKNRRIEINLRMNIPREEQKYEK